MKIKSLKGFDGSIFKKLSFFFLLNHLVFDTIHFFPQRERVMESVGPGHGTECFQDCSFLAAAPSEQATSACDRRGTGSLGRTVSNHSECTEEKSSWLLSEWEVENTRCQAVVRNDGWESDNNRDRRKS